MIPTAFVSQAPDLVAVASTPVPDMAAVASPELAVAAAASTTAAMTSNLLVSFCSQLAPATSIAVSAAPLLTFQQLRQENRGVGELPLLPYSTLAANCILWTTYGLMQDATSIWMPNGIGLLLALYYMASYRDLHNNNKSTPPAHTNQDATSQTIQQHVNAVGMVALASLVGSHTVSADMIGQVAVCFCIGLFASPLVSVQEILRLKSGASERISLPSTLSSLVSSGLWSVSGIADLHDLHVILPNVLGVGFGAVQVALLALYGDSTSSTASVDMPQRPLGPSLVPVPVAAATQPSPRPFAASSRVPVP